MSGGSFRRNFHPSFDLLLCLFDSDALVLITRLDLFVKGDCVVDSSTVRFMSYSGKIQTIPQHSHSYVVTSGDARLKEYTFHASPPHKGRQQRQQRQRLQ